MIVVTCEDVVLHQDKVPLGGPQGERAYALIREKALYTLTVRRLRPGLLHTLAFYAALDNPPLKIAELDWGLAAVRTEAKLIKAEADRQRCNLWGCSLQTLDRLSEAAGFNIADVRLPSPSRRSFALHFTDKELTR